jgi:flagellar hook-basal body complex protein FliE
VSNEKVSAFVAGEEQSLHEVMISMNKAKLQFELMSEVRNKGLQAYQKLMQTQV